LKSNGERGWREIREGSAKKFTKGSTKPTSVTQRREEQTSKILKYVIKVRKTMNKEQHIYKRKVPVEKEKFEKMKRFEGKLASTMTDACQRRAPCSAKAEVTPLRRDTEKLNYLYEN
jgi:hypothetical protein